MEKITEKQKEAIKQYVIKLQFEKQVLEQQIIDQQSRIEDLRAECLAWRNMAEQRIDDVAKSVQRLANKIFSP